MTSIALEKLITFENLTPSLKHITHGKTAMIRAINGFCFDLLIIKVTLPHKGFTVVVDR